MIGYGHIVMCVYPHRDQDSPLSSEPTEVTNINILPTQEMESSSTDSTLITSVIDPLPQ